MSIGVDMLGNSVNVRRGRMVLSDLDQIKKNERDRRRRLRLEQVRQQSKEISNRLLERAKKIARDELNKLESDGRSELRQMHERKLVDMQLRYQEDLEDIGRAHACATLQPDADAMIEEEGRRDRATALRRGKDALECVREAKQTDGAEAVHQERLRRVRETENARAAMVARLPRPPSSAENDAAVRSPDRSPRKEATRPAPTPKRRSKKLLPRKSPGRVRKSNPREHQTTASPKPGPSGLQRGSAARSHEPLSRDRADGCVVDDASDDQVPRKTAPVMSAVPDKAARYNPEDYTQDTWSNVSSSSSGSTSDDSSYFSDGVEQVACGKAPRTPAATENKVRSQCTNTQRVPPAHDRPPLCVVERSDIRNERSAMEAAQAARNAGSAEARACRSRRLNVQRRGEDAILRERVRRDYQALLRNLDHLAREERKLKASQTRTAEEDACARLHQRTICREECQRRLNRAAKKVLGAECRCTHLAERVVTLPTRKRHDGRDDVPHSTWQDPHLVEDVCRTPRDREDEGSREEQILDMLKKVERQKWLLLQEFGASLPDNIFNVSVRPLFEDETPRAPETVCAARPASPEIKVINMSSSDECVRKDCRARRPDESPAAKIEIAVQTAPEQARPAANKSVQVELPREEDACAPAPDTSGDTPARVPHPIEPNVTIITPESDDISNNSTSPEISEMIIEIGNREVIVTPKKRRSGVRVSKRPSPRVYQKIRPTSVGSKATSPAKRFSWSQSGVRSTPQKKTRCAAARRVDVHVSQVEDDETDPSQGTRVSIDASAESSQTISGLNDEEPSSGGPYRVRTQTRRSIRMRDTSDTSTSLASPPPVKPRSMLDALSNITQILELLDSPGFEDVRRLRRDISPVSTPETPSPRTMMMPSNVPHRDRIARMLRFSVNDSEANGTVVSSTQRDQSTLTDPSDVRQVSEASERVSTASQQPSARVCICKNPQCKLLHVRLDDIHDYALKNCPEILQKYEDLQNLCTERIASLTDLIEKVRNEQKDMDFSLMDDTSLMQLPTPKSARNDAQTVRRLIDSIEEIHAQLARTLLESQSIMRGGEAVSTDTPSCDTEFQAVTSTPRSKLLDKAHVQESKVVEGRAEPKIISNERVNVHLNRFKMQQKPQEASATRAPERNSWPPCTLSLHEEEVIEKLSKEILEQSKNLDRASAVFTASKERDEAQHKVPSSKELHPGKGVSLEHETNSNVAKELTSTPETAKESGLVPTLTSIPKILRSHGNVASISVRPKPPVTLLNGLYRPELESSGHELSTIVEFDTTDTVNKSSKSPAKSKPSVHVAPLPVQQNQNFSRKSADSSFGTKHSAEKPSSAQKSQDTTTTCNSPDKLKSMAACITETKVEAEREYMLEKCNKQLQCNTTAEEAVCQAKDKLGSSISTDFHKESKHKTTSTSLYSFSGLSGISEITSSPSSDMLKHNSSPEEMETALKKLGLGWAVTTLKKTREASALSSSSNSDVTPVNTARRMISPTKKQHYSNGFPDISDVSSISIKEASKSTEQAVLLKGRTSTPKFQNSNSNSERSSTTNTSESAQDPSDSLTVPNVSLTKTKSDNKQLQSP
ncbi:PREDICTED: uncharacterized protein LOC105570674 [Vollenhovia emeryi]|uniref:uncharacterized protein LOC105570674 n=1 Tax=Vollenhovia emeryi TaxID=411798 RepID=UPI0005F4F794|nr:PREDICTED: uncharacterized protein LOC105570674 [Vollenhovia emeryi]